MTVPTRIDFPHGITAIDTDYVRPALAASHLMVQDGRAAFIDTGTTLSVPRLLETLRHKHLDVGQVDYLLLTHVHLDHAGGAGKLMQALPEAKAVVHPRGAPHMIDPAKLIAGTKAVYGEGNFHKLYGEVPPIDKERVLIAGDGDVLELAGRPLELIHTPGHALHHYCIVDREANAIFAGDTFGVSYRELDTANGEFILPTTTPVQFDPAASHVSVDRLLSYEPDAIFLTHYSRVCDIDRLAGDMHECLDAFVEIARRHADDGDREALMTADMFDFLSDRLDQHGYDPDADRRHRYLDMDIGLNVQGLCAWLNREAKQRTQ